MSMDSAELRAVQEPLKDTYRENPREALVTLRAHGQLDEQATAEQLQTLIRLTERYCVVYQTLAHPPELTMTVGLAPGS
jgi:uncharacterized OsmC-like protein